MTPDAADTDETEVETPADDVEIIFELFDALLSATLAFDG